MILDSELRVMQMNRSIKGGLILLLTSAVSLAVLAADTEDQPSKPAESEAVPETLSQTPRQTPPQTPPQTGDGEPETQQEAEKAPPVTGTAVKTIKEFKPTEQIEADSAVSFPIDI